MGTTPITGHEVLAGEHELRLATERAGVECSLGGVAIRPDETTILHVDAATCQAKR